jgi:tetratricopeptide (TPR) repeat protein
MQPRSEEETKELIEKGEAYLESEDYEEAKKSFEKATTLDEKDARAWIGLGRAYVDLKNYEEAKKCLDKATELDEGAQSGKSVIF